MRFNLVAPVSGYDANVFNTTMHILSQQPLDHRDPADLDKWLRNLSRGGAQARALSTGL